MYIKSILAGAAMVLAAGVGAASAADQFTTLAGIAAQPLTVDALETEHVGTFSYLAGVAPTPMDAEELAGTYGTFAIWVTRSSIADHQHMMPPQTLFPPTGEEIVTVGCGGGLPMAGMVGC